MNKLLNKIYLWPGYYALIVTLAGVLVSTASWIVAIYIPGYLTFLKTLDLSWTGAVASIGVLLPIGSISAFDHFTGRRSIKIKAFMNNERMLWQLSCFIFTAFFIAILLNIFKHYVSIHIINGINLAYTVFVGYSIVTYFKMLLTNK